ncbi:hypothetical protein [Bacillus pumilus]|uniref:hypothetical protein n=1 Tax=Bacillus pumilus TaxID=1408 RepID=UPI00164275B5|nr:hypothetical protein [Bacillus pumilus]
MDNVLDIEGRIKKMRVGGRIRVRVKRIRGVWNRGFGGCCSCDRRMVGGILEGVNWLVR